MKKFSEFNKSIISLDHNVEVKGGHPVIFAVGMWAFMNIVDGMVTGPNDNGSCTFGCN